MLAESTHFRFGMGPTLARRPALASRYPCPRLGFLLCGWDCVATQGRQHGSSRGGPSVTPFPRGGLETRWAGSCLPLGPGRPQGTNAILHNCPGGHPWDSDAPALRSLWALSFHSSPSLGPDTIVQGCALRCGLMPGPPGGCWAGQPQHPPSPPQAKLPGAETRLRLPLLVPSQLSACRPVPLPPVSPSALPLLTSQLPTCPAALLLPSSQPTGLGL